MKPMLPKLKMDIPPIGEWMFEVKYDGFRAILEWDHEEIHLWSRNEKDLLPQFPEIKEYLLQNLERIEGCFPLKLDGELTLLENPYKSNFNGLQVRGRMRSQKDIKDAAGKRPCTYLVFDLLELGGKTYMKTPYSIRKDRLEKFLKESEFSLSPCHDPQRLMQMVNSFRSFQDVWKEVFLNHSEGVVAKNKNSIWSPGKRTDAWIKIKNWKEASCFIVGYNKNNGYFDVAVFRDGDIFSIGQFLSGLNPMDKKVLIQTIIQNGTQTGDYIEVPPGICIQLQYLELYEGRLREPRFKEFLFNASVSECTYEKFRIDSFAFPKKVELTHLDKPLWKDPFINKLEYVSYLRRIAPHLLPFLKDRLLTVIRLPHGMFGDSFFQKNCPEYAPSYIETYQEDEIDYILCNHLDALIWLGNQLAIEFHVPFQKAGSPFVSEIVFDLDPPDRNHFHMAVAAAQQLKILFDSMNLISFVKTSGNKGLQVYLPLPENIYSWSDTRLFTEFIAHYLVSQSPDLFTVERLKKNRGNRLYFDYIQHAQGKTIIAPYSMRGNEDALVAAPLFWDEIKSGLMIETFTTETVLERLNKRGCPFSTYHESKDRQPFAPIVKYLKENK
ncbi:DNA ligase D [Falsibacillus albus]|uniref:DNA ligase (ATP) n=1 Tax=Falsibacillus albus TaxID=2478915 RepID=A0A3L7JWL1_9BACI|nr:DNA ligase D [Falsibacillus albus]RLQ95237.1 DNA ligase D [Falsibacillus albus]